MSIDRSNCFARLHDLAHAHAGDKGNRCNISLIPYHPDVFPFLVDHVTEEIVLAHFRYRGVSSVHRYMLSRLPALNFVLDDALEGGVNRSLGLDGHGQSLSFHLLALSIRIPRELVPRR